MQSWCWGKDTGMVWLGEQGIECKHLFFQRWQFSTLHQFMACGREGSVDTLEAKQVYMSISTLEWIAWHATCTLATWPWLWRLTTAFDSICSLWWWWRLVSWHCTLITIAYYWKPERPLEWTISSKEQMEILKHSTCSCLDVRPIRDSILVTYQLDHGSSQEEKAEESYFWMSTMGVKYHVERSRQWHTRLQYRGSPYFRHLKVFHKIGYTIHCYVPLIHIAIFHMSQGSTVLVTWLDNGDQWWDHNTSRPWPRSLYQVSLSRDAHDFNWWEYGYGSTLSLLTNARLHVVPTLVIANPSLISGVQYVSWDLGRVISRTYRHGYIIPLDTSMLSYAAARAVLYRHKVPLYDAFVHQR